ncbi:MAG: triose-phosphate isomerase [Nitrososphaerales archaeon]
MSNGKIAMRYFVINTKNFLEASGKQLDQIASYIENARNLGRTNRIFLAVPAFELHYLHSKYPRIRLIAQHLDDARVGPSTGALVPEIAKVSGAFGSIINHSEHRLNESSIVQIVKRLRELKMVSVVCARDDDEVARLTACNPDFIAVEPPELIGSGRAVSKASPEIITRSKSALEKSKGPNSKTRLLCGAGIVDRDDARMAIELGAEGILVASGVVLSKNWKDKIGELSKGLSDAG